MKDSKCIFILDEFSKFYFWMNFQQNFQTNIQHPRWISRIFSHTIFPCFVVQNSKISPGYAKFFMELGSRGSRFLQAWCSIGKCQVATTAANINNMITHQNTWIPNVPRFIKILELHERPRQSGLNPLRITILLQKM